MNDRQVVGFDLHEGDKGFPPSRGKPVDQSLRPGTSVPQGRTSNKLR